MGQKIKTGEIILALVKFIVQFWDFITWPIYQMIYRPWEKRKTMEKIRSRALRTSDQEIVYEAPEKRSELFEDMVRHHCDTMAKAWSWAVDRYGKAALLGTRDILAEEDEAQPNGKVFKKYHLGDYRWVSYEDADATAEYYGKGLRALGLEPRSNVCIFADTRSEWMITAQACFKQTFPLVTLYTNLGEDAVVHGVNQTQGRKVNDKPEFQAVPPTPKDLAIIMYTSGSTGVPKGVMLSHKNIFNTLKSIMLSVEVNATPSDTYIAYLPLAHVLELLCENMMIMYGVKIGYSNPNTMTDKSSMVKKGSKGDASMLQPTIMTAVPLILDRIYKAVSDTVNRRGPAFEKLFKFCYEYRLNAMKNGEETPIMDRLIFSKIKAMLGGRMRLLMSGGAPLSKETHDYMRVCIGCPLIQGYGLTETTACATLMEVSEMSSGKVGPPNQGMQLKLVNWEEGNYRVTDSPRPRGEIIVGGNAVAEGYYLMPDKTAEDFYDEYGRRWFKTGDIGQMEADGTLRIIDRKKDLVKLQFGEYVSLGKVESVLKTCPVVENVCIYGDSTKSYCVALVTPDRKQLSLLAGKFEKQDLSFEDLCSDKDVTGACLRELVNHSKTHRLEKFEIPGAVSLITDAWIPDSGLVTAAFKLKRKPIQEKYQRHIDRMYGVK